MVAKNYIKISLLLLSLIVLGYTFSRAYLLSFTHDESLSFLYYVNMNVSDIWQFNNPYAPSNNHLLNTLLMKLSSYLFGNQEFFLRFPNLLSHILYIVFSALIALKINQRLSILIFIIINFNPYVLDYFSLARGYGLGLGFMMASLYFLYRCFQVKEKSKYYWFQNNEFSCALFAFLAVLANFSFLYFYISSQLVILIISVLKIIKLPQKTSKNQLLISLIIWNKEIIIIGVMTYILVVPAILKLRELNELSVGGDRGFYQDTVYSLIEIFFYGQNYPNWLINFLYILLIVITNLFFVFLLYKLLKPLYKSNKTKSEKVDYYKQHIENNLSLYVTIFMIIIIVATNVFLGIKFPMRRAAIYLIPLTQLAIIEIINNISKYKIHKLGLFTISLISGLCLFHFLNCANLSYSLNWHYDADTRAIIEKLEIISEDTNKEPTKLVTNWIFKPSLEFYRTTRKLDWLELVNNRNPEEFQQLINENYDYYYLTFQDWQKLKQNNPQLSVIKTSRIANNILLQSNYAHESKESIK